MRALWSDRPKCSHNVSHNVKRIRRFSETKLATPPTCYRSLSGPSRLKCPESVPEGVPENGGCPRECPKACPWGPLGPGLRSVQKVSQECPRSVPDTFLTLRGHSRDTFWTLRSPRRKGPRDTPSDTPSNTHVFKNAFGDTLGTLRAQRPERVRLL